MTRLGAINCNLETWHKDIKDFIDLKKNGGEEKRRAKELFTSVSCSDMFMKRVENNEEYTLFDPYDVPELTELYGKAFEEQYEYYEKLFEEDPDFFTNEPVRVNAKDVWKKIQSMAWDTGMPFVYFKDNANNDLKPNYDEVGLIRSGNLCVAGDTKILTKEYGNIEIGKLVNFGITEATCWNGEEWSLTPIFKTSDSEKVFKVVLSNGESIKATDYHKWYINKNGIKEVRTHELKKNDEIISFNMPDGSSVFGIKIVYIEGENEKVPVYCGTEPKRNMLVFNNVLTGNCMEYLSPIKDNDVTLCNLGSINLAKAPKERLREVVFTATRMLDNVIDVTEYRIPNSEKTQKERRSIGLGIAGEAEAIANLKIMYGSEEHLEWIEEIYSIFKEASDDASRELAKERGACKYNSEFRNYHRRCIAPTSSIGLILGTTTSHEPAFGKVWIEENILGDFKMTAPDINTDNYKYYISAYDVDQIKYVETTARRQKYIDMGISHNAYFIPEETKGKDVYDMYITAWKKGLKTVYYLRSKSRKAEDEEFELVENKVVCFGCA